MKLTKADIVQAHVDYGGSIDDFNLIDSIPLSRLREIWKEYKRGGRSIENLFGEVLD